MNPAALWDSLLGNQRHNSRTVTVCRSWQYWKRHPFIITSSPQDSGRLTHDWLTGCPSRHILFFLHSLLWSLGSVLSTQALSPHRVSCLSRLFSTIWRNIPHELESFPDMYTGTSICFDWTLYKHWATWQFGQQKSHPWQNALLHKSLHC